MKRLSNLQKFLLFLLALLAAAGVERVPVVAAPRVRVVVAGPKGAGGDAHASMLCALVARDGGTVEVSRGAAALRDELARPGADVLVATGRTGAGADDDAPSVLGAVGELAFHGVALRPGGSAAVGTAAGRPVVLLPGDPLACACAYEVLAGRLVRLLAGRDGGLPHRTCEAAVRRKIVSAIGSVDVCQVRLVEGGAEPLGVAEFGGLGAAARADGFVLVPAALEGWPPGSRVTVHLH
jgi:molybdopterin molybdotransferase